MRRTAKPLHDKALSSLRRAVRAYNDLDDDGRVTTVLLHLQHAFEMLLKAGLDQRRVAVMDPATGYSAGIDKCINLSREHLGLTAAEAGTIRAIDAMRDHEQHWFAEVDEGILYNHMVAGVSLFQQLLKQVFDEDLRDHLPARVVPIATEPPKDIQFFIDRQFEEIKTLLLPNSRQAAKARARIRTLLAMEAHVDDRADQSERDVNSVVDGIKEGLSRDEVFPRLAALGSEHGGGQALEIQMRFVRRDGDDVVPVKYVGEDYDGPVAAIRERDRRDRYKWSLEQLYKRFGLGNQKGKALRLRAGISDDNPKYADSTTIGATTFVQYSDEALGAMRDTLEELGIDRIWEDYKNAPPE